MPSRIPLSVPSLAGNEAEYLRQCVETNWVSSAGPFVGRFEDRLADAVGAPEAVAVASGTAALHLALLAAGVGPGDEVLTSSLTFVAPANAVRYVGARPVFVDADPDTWQMDWTLIARFLADRCEPGADGPVNRETGNRVAAILPVHILGHPVDMEPVADLAHEHGLKIVEDATESLGAACRGRPVGRLGDLGCFSFNGNKIATCGGGGAVVTADPSAAAEVRHLATQARIDAVGQVHDRVGYNYRLTNVQAAIGCAQLERLADLVAAKVRIAGRYRDGLADVPGITMMPTAPWAEPVYWLSAVRADPAAYGRGAPAIVGELADAGIESRLLWQPLHRSPAHAGAEALGGAVAERLHDEVVCLPSSVDLEPSDQDRVIDRLRRLCL